MTIDEVFAQAFKASIAESVEQALREMPREILTARVWLSTPEVAERYRVNARTLHKWSDAGFFPKPIKITEVGSARLWLLKDLEQWEQRKLEERP